MRSGFQTDVRVAFEKWIKRKPYPTEVVRGQDAPMTLEKNQVRPCELRRHTRHQGPLWVRGASVWACHVSHSACSRSAGAGAARWRHVLVRQDVLQELRGELCRARLPAASCLAPKRAASAGTPPRDRTQRRIFEQKIGIMSPTPAWQCELRTATELSQSWAESLFIASRVGANRTVPATHARSRRTDSRNERVSAHPLTSGRGSAKGTLD